MTIHGNEKPSRKLANLVLVVVGILYPFIVYVGGDHVSPPVFGVILGALWLIRAPALVHQPGGKWMLGVALAYCALLAFGGHEHLLRWYPSLICALLLAAFTHSLVFGPPIIERVARMMEPDLPQAALPYTRKVTGVWAAFFAINGACSAWLAAWGPLSWWTFYNGVVAYVAMGTLFAVEWVCRQRMRRRLRNAPMGSAAVRLASHPWVAAAAGGNAGQQVLGMVVALTASGRIALARHGRAGIVSELGQHAAGDDALATPMAWRFVEGLPEAARIDLLLQAPLPRIAQVVSERVDAGTHVLSLALPLDLACFAEHFPEAPVLPGVLQIAWALEFASSRFGTPRTCRGMDQLKFQRLLRPGDQVELVLRHDAERGRLHFAYRVGDAMCSSAHLHVDAMPGVTHAQ
ncbi:hypothetical protein [Luteibacter aegosomatissinici]|uniref:ApeI family dehydratase n=1 Tax=Luteibacter aegosomatissinici TaxID=2911539 RepID=UPI001FF9B430|nr:hypothetical protein [Luteibacter aegosomatissinici]UPG93326.1 hypothetical protein L2Y97_15890 [Luteibacter aegosomatissinici]